MCVSTITDNNNIICYQFKAKIIINEVKITEIVERTGYDGLLRKIIWKKKKLSYLSMTKNLFL